MLALEMKGISKTFPGVRALTNVDLDVTFGTIHAIVGENGAGKSTLMKVLNGIYAPSAGSIRINGERVTLAGPAHAQDLGIRMVHQELNLVPDLNVAENIYLGRMPTRRGLLDKAAMISGARAVLDELGAQIDPRTLVQDLSISQQQIVEIAKSYAANPRIIVLDEPTSSLSEHEAAILFDMLRRMRASGIAIVYISHRLREVLTISDTVTVLRDGEMIETRPIEGVSAADMIRLMVGRAVTTLFPKRPVDIGDVVLSVSDLSDGHAFSNVSFDVRAGEIVGLTGLVGAGRSEVARTIFGLSPKASGTIRTREGVINPGSPGAAMKCGIAYVPEDRKGDGIIPAMSIRENITLPIIRALSRLGLGNVTTETTLSHDLAVRFGINPPDTTRRIDTLSGGNQQKAVLAKWLATKPSVLILDEPTRGVDVGAKSDIHAIIGELVAEGIGVLMISSELTEVMAVSDRVYVMHEGKIAPPLGRADLSEERIMMLATGETDGGSDSQ